MHYDLKPEQLKRRHLATVIAATVGYSALKSPPAHAQSYTPSYSQTPFESAAGVTPRNSAYQPGDVRRYGAVGDGVTDDTAAFANWAKVLAYCDGVIYHTAGGYLLSSNIVLPPGARIQGAGYRPLISSTGVGKEIFACIGTGVEELIIEGVRLRGRDASTEPLNAYGGASARATGLVTAAKLAFVRLSNIQCSTFYTPLAVIRSSNVKIDGCCATDFLYTGILAACCTRFAIDRNVIDNCAQNGPAVSYGVQCTGDIEAGKYPSQQNSISFNKISGIRSWDGIGSHDIDGLAVIGNDIRDVRSGIDLGHLQATNTVRNLAILGNYIESTASDTWAGASAQHCGIVVAGYDPSCRVSGARIVGNTIRNFYTVEGLVAAGYPGHISVANTDDASVTGNAVIEAGASAAGSRGVFANGVCNRLAICDNTLQGDMSDSAINIESVNADVAIIRGNVAAQTRPANGGITVTRSTIAQFNCEGNASNATPAYTDDAGTGGSILTPVGGSQASSCTLSLTDCTTAPSASVKYQLNGDLVTLELPDLVATSNSTACTLTGLPACLQPAIPQSCVGVVYDNGKPEVSRIQVESAGGDGGTITLFVGANPGFTTAGTKGIGRSTITYRRTS